MQALLDTEIGHKQWCWLKKSMVFVEQWSAICYISMPGSPVTIWNIQLRAAGRVAHNHADVCSMTCQQTGPCQILPGLSCKVCVIAACKSQSGTRWCLAVVLAKCSPEQQHVSAPHSQGSSPLPSACTGLPVHEPLAQLRHHPVDVCEATQHPTEGLLLHDVHSTTARHNLQIQHHST